MIDLDNSKHSLACNLNATETGRFDLCICGLTAAREEDERQRREAEISVEGLFSQADYYEGVINGDA